MNLFIQITRLQLFNHRIDDARTGITKNLNSGALRKDNGFKKIKKVAIQRKMGNKRDWDIEYD